MNKVRVGIIGTGSIAQIAHFPALMAMEDVEIAGVLGSSREKSEQAARRCGVPVAAGNLDELLKQDLDAVFLLTPKTIRREYLKKAALFGLAGIVIGIIAGIIPGQGLAGMLLSSMGAYGFHFIIDPLSVFLLIPAVIIAAAGAAVLIALREVDRIATFECLGAGSGKC